MQTAGVRRLLVLSEGAYSPYTSGVTNHLISTLYEAFSAPVIRERHLHRNIAEQASASSAVARMCCRLRTASGAPSAGADDGLSFEGKHCLRQGSPESAGDGGPYVAHVPSFVCAMHDAAATPWTFSMFRGPEKGLRRTVADQVQLRDRRGDVGQVVREELDVRATRFSSRRCSLVVPGIDMIQDFCASTIPERSARASRPCARPPHGGDRRGPDSHLGGETRDTAAEVALVQLRRQVDLAIAGYGSSTTAHASHAHATWSWIPTGCSPRPASGTSSPTVPQCHGCTDSNESRRGKKSTSHDGSTRARPWPPSLQRSLISGSTTTR